MMALIHRCWAALALLVGLLWALWVGTAIAQGPETTKMELLLPPSPAVGQEMVLAAHVTRASGTPVSGVEVAFTRAAQFLNTDSEVVLGKALTDKKGVATFSFIPRTEGELALTARFAGNAQYQRSAASVKAQIGAGPSLYTETAGIRVTGINVMWLIALLAGVWAVFFTVMALLALIAREGESGPQPGQAYGSVGSSGVQGGFPQAPRGRRG